MERIILDNLQVSEFIHPDELANKQKALENGTVQKALNAAAEFCRIAVEPLTQGTFVKIDDNCAPNVIKIVRDVCRILDVESVPDVYLCHLMSTNITPLGSNSAYLVVPDYVLRYFDDDMLYYNFGNAVTMIKAEHVRLTTLAAYMPGGLLIDIPKLLFIAYLHCADATSDRGGLLACQSFAAAARCHLFELGMPPGESRKLFTTDNEAEIFVEKYLSEHAAALNRFSNIIVRAARTWQNMSYLEAPANKMLREMFNWYRDAKGYKAVIRNHGGKI